MGPEISYSLPQLLPGMMDPLITNDWPEIPGDRWEIAANTSQRGWPYFWIIIADRDAAILAHFRHHDIGLEMGPEIGYP